MLVHPSAVNSLVLVGSLGLGSAAAPKGSIRERRLLQKKDLLSPSGGAPPFNEKNRRGDGRPGRRKERRAKIAELKSESSTEEIPAVDTGVIGHEAVAAPVASKLDVGFVDCDGGLVEGVTCEEACGGDCCVGSGACDYFTGRVAKDGSCDGDHACIKAEIGEVSGQSCVGGSSCKDVLAQSITDSSCIGEIACLGSEIDDVISGKSCDKSLFLDFLASLSTPNLSPTRRASESKLAGALSRTMGKRLMSPVGPVWDIGRAIMPGSTVS
ncbi:hypothetical protein THAOC_11602 [Thalassiosira oceanica]|uniref:DUF7640 domain-containing protein n=1 Tax=Thalassiosira oceanica TaxID=159749 RepID=K0SQS9_THAOC|nr:hypothetical protein THAOC_11602 [Thalassiosira oceanica]|eukprot:EJK67374.1 hypothetical protein THAOC_11602 [Thalassiosira oceanica]